MFRIMTKCNKQYIVVKSQYVHHILQYIAIHFWHIVTALMFSLDDAKVYTCMLTILLLLYVSLLFSVCLQFVNKKNLPTNNWIL